MGWTKVHWGDVGRARSLQGSDQANLAGRVFCCKVTNHPEKTTELYKLSPVSNGETVEVSEERMEMMFSL